MIRLTAVLSMFLFVLFPHPLLARDSSAIGTPCATGSPGEACGPSTGGANATCRALGASLMCLYPECPGDGNCGTGKTCQDLTADGTSYRACVPSSTGNTTSSAGPGTELAPRLSVNIPTVHFSPIESENEDDPVGIPWIADYIEGVHKYAVGAAAVVAAAMFMIGGFQYLTAGGDAGRVSAGKERITNALVGLLLVVSSWLLLNTFSADLVQLKGIVVTQVTTKDYKAMANEFGFRNPDPAAGGPAPEVGSGSALPQPPQDGENVDITTALQVAQSRSGGPQRMEAFCAAGRGSLDTYDAKIQALVQVMLGWKRICVDEKKCAYLRSGYTNLSTGRATVTLLDLPYAVKSIMNNSGEPPAWPDEGCARDYAAIQGCWYKYCVETFTSVADLRAQQEAHKAQYAHLRGPGGRCYDAVKGQYDTIIAGAYYNHGVYGGDCGSTLVQAYMCAGGRVAVPGYGQTTSAAAYTSGQRVGMGSSGADVVVFAGKNEADVIEQITNKGGIKFGDIVNMGQQNWQHNFMYTGGREDVPFSIFEMGGAGRDGSTGTLVSVGLRAPIGGVRVHPSSADPRDDFINYLRRNEQRLRARGKSIYPIYVWRPYNYEPCQNKTQCAEGENCGCSFSDCSGSGGRCLGDDKCGMNGICHKVKISQFCNEDNDCANGQTCQRHQCKNAN